MDKGKIKLWLDDDIERRSPEGWVVARTADKAIELLKTGEVEKISLDRDLGDKRLEPYPYEVTGENVVAFMVAEKIFPKYIYIHTWNSDAAKRMKKELDENKPEGVRVEVSTYSLRYVETLEALDKTMMVEDKHPGAIIIDFQEAKARILAARKRL
jgi:hypothetical protein